MVPSLSVAADGRRMRCAASFMLALLGCANFAAQAQTAATNKRPDPLDAQAHVPAVVYQSAFAQYKPLGDEKTRTWRDSNDTVARIGGWRVYAREAQQPDPQPSVRPASALPPAGHGGHGGQGGHSGHSGHKMP